MGAASPARGSVKQPERSSAAAVGTPIVRKRRQDNIDLLRAAAIVSVMLYHFTARHPAAFYRTDHLPFIFANGNLGVDLFFVVSGFCIFMTLDSSRTLENFWARRLARIQPAYMVAIVVTSLVVGLAGLPGHPQSARIALSNMFWFEVIPDWPMVDNAYWSLVVELKFYLWIGLIYYLVGGRYVSLAWLAFSLAGALLVHSGKISEMIGTGLLIGPYAPMFLAGLLAWEWDRLPRRMAIAMSVICAALLLSSPRFAHTPGAGVLIGVAGFAILRMRSLKVPRPITFVGLISYSLYLLHQNLGYVLLRAIPLPIELRLTLVFAILIGLAALSYWAVERRWERPAQRLAEHLLGHGRRRLGLPHRKIWHPTLTEELRSW